MSLLKRILQLYKTRRDLLGTQFTFPTLRTINPVYFSNDGLPFQPSFQDQKIFDGKRIFLKCFGKCKALFTQVQEETFRTT